MKQNNKQIPEGYKNSSLGIIPKEWEVKKLGEIGSQLSTFTFSRAQITKEPQQLRYIHYGDIHLNDEKDKVSLDKDILPFLCDGLIPNEKQKKEDFPYLKNGDLLMADASEDYNGIGKPLEIVNTNNEKIIGGLHTIALRLDAKYIFIGFGRFLFKNKYDFHLLRRIAQGTKVYSISYKNIAKLDILIPPLPEQKRIVEILNTWDEAIEKQSKLVNALTLRKRGLMQQLLTGKRHILGFNKKWEKVKIKSIANKVSLRNHEKKDLTVLSCTKYNGLVPSLEYFGKQIFSNDTSSYKIVPKNSFAYSTNHIEEGSIGYQDRYEQALISPMYTVFTTSDIVNNHYIYSLLKSKKCIYEYKRRMEGSIDRRGGLKWEAFSNIPLKLPALKEQNAIMKITTTADIEIELAEQKLAHLRNQKRGLMQQLLTGKTRVKF